MVEKMRGLSLLFLIVLLFVGFSIIVFGGCITHITESTSTKYDNDIWFRGCEYGSTQITGCPENEYLAKRTFECKSECVKCCSSCGGTPPTCCDPPTCVKWKTTGCTGEPLEEHICGMKNNSWTTLNTEGWYCPTCKDLALWHGGNPPVLNLSSFDSLSIKDDDGILRSGDNVDLNFNVYIKACINRIPMLNLNVKLVNASGITESEEYGIYSKHTTLDYANEHSGILEDFIIPNQTEFRKSYTLRGNLKAYRPWGWRKRFVEAVERIVSEKNLQIPGFPSSPQSQKIGDLYFSEDFLAGIKLPGGGLACKETFTRDQTFFTDVLHDWPKLNSEEICKVKDLEDYYSNYGITPQLNQTIRDLLSARGKITDLDIMTGKNERWDFNHFENGVDVSDLGYSKCSDFVKDAQDPAKYDMIFSKLKARGIISSSELSNGCKESRAAFFNTELKGCDSYSPQFTNYRLNEISVSSCCGDGICDPTENSSCPEDCSNSNASTVPLKIEGTAKLSTNGGIPEFICGDGICDPTENCNNCPQDCGACPSPIDKKVNLNLKIACTWKNDILAKLILTTESTYNCTESWDWGSLGNLSGPTLAKCLYNWNDCLLNKQSNYYEAADCGMGPPSKLLNTTLKDAARGEKSLEFGVTVYRNCEGTAWVTSDRRYICDGSDPVKKCKFNPSSDEVSFVEKVNPGESFIVNGTSYVCDTDGKFKIDDLPPIIECDNCYDYVDTGIIFRPIVSDNPNSEYVSGVETVKICGDPVCKETFCSYYSPQDKCFFEVGSCDYLSDQEFWIYAEDMVGNSVTVKGGKFDIKKALDCPCSYDLECNSGKCEGAPSVCVENPIPIIYIV